MDGSAGARLAKRKNVLLGAELDCAAGILRRLPLAGLAGSHPLVEFSRLFTWDAERFPPGVLQVLGQKDNLPHVVGIVGELTVDGLHHRMGFAPDVYLARSEERR